MLRATSAAFSATHLNIIPLATNSGRGAGEVCISHALATLTSFRRTGFRERREKKSYRTALHTHVITRRAHAHASSLTERRSSGELTQTVIQRAGESRPVVPERRKRTNTAEARRIVPSQRERARTNPNQACASRTFNRQPRCLCPFVVRGDVA